MTEELTDGSRILTFFRGGADDRGRTLDEILAWNRERLEYTHDYIQWLFPLRERSGANPGAPVLTDTDVRAFATDAVLRQQLLRALRMMIDFYGLDLIDPETRDAPDPRVIRRPGFDGVATGWLFPGSHNFLRLTRILISLRTLGLDPYARALFEALRAIYADHASRIGATTYAYWQRAMAEER
jgi:hypothetical protein